jgi:DNA-binding LacI/PurR family transcriptional regulator
MEETRYKKPPFELKRTMRGGLAEQLAAEFRRAINTGYYRPGDMLPPVREQTALLKVSRVVVVRAMAMLAEERLVHPRPHYGCEVCSRENPLWKGQVLIIVPPGIGNPRDNTVYAILRDALTANGYLPLAVSVFCTAPGRYGDFALLETQLKQQIDLVVSLVGEPEVIRWLAKREIPFVQLTTSMLSPSNCHGRVLRRADLALDDFIAHCREARVRSVLQVTAMRTGPNAVPALKKAGIEASNWRIPPPDGGWNAVGLVQHATDEFAARLARDGRKWLPDMIFFRDDHLTTGALPALMAAGIRIPEDVRIVTWANRGLGPAFVKPFTRMEFDIKAAGETMARCVLEYLRTGVFPSDVTVGPAYIRGETF